MIAVEELPFYADGAIQFPDGRLVPLCLPLPYRLKHAPQPSNPRMYNLAQSNRAPVASHYAGLSIPIAH
jgi:hypothetical protein